MRAYDEERLLSTLLHIDQLMADALTILQFDAEANLRRFRCDCSPEEREAIQKSVRHLRETLSRIPPKEGLSLPEPQTSLLRAVHARVLLARVALDEYASHPPRLRPSPANSTG